MRTIRILACVVAVLAVSAVTAASAAAAPEFDAASYPVEQKAAGTNNQGFNGGGVVIVCTEFTANTNEDAKTPNPTKNSPTLKVHPIYKNCRGTVAAGSFPVTVETAGCDYKVHAAIPGKLEGSVDIECETGKEIVNTFVGLTGCTVNVKPQNGLKSIIFTNAPKTGTETAEVTTGSEVAKIKSKAASGCGLAIGTAEFEAEYRQGKITTIAGVETAEIEPTGHPANSVSQAFTAAKVQEAAEVGINEPHWYENKVPLSAQSGEAGQEGNDVLMWGKVTLASTEVGTTNCQTLWGGDVYDPGGSGAFGFGNAAAGGAKIDAFHAFDCEEPVGEKCQTEHASKLSVEAEGLDKFGEWGAKLSGPPVKVKLGTGVAAEQIKLNVVCPGTGEYVAKWTGELAPELEAGTAIGAAPSKLQFNSGSLSAARTLPTVGTEEGKVTNNVKMMGFEGGSVISTKNP
jgi:hypothetical protein